MLPYTPLQHLLLAAAEARGMHALIMTSGNLSEEPIETDDDLAWERLVAAGIADALLGNDRAILSRYDDSVVRVVDGAAMPVRRARGYAPQPLALPALDGTAPCVLACGPQQKATIALTREDADGHVACFVSQHIGDVENGETSMPGTPRARAWKISLTWRPPPWPAICTPAIYRASGRASRHGSTICRSSRCSTIMRISRA